MVDPQRLEYLRSTLYKVTPFRAEDLEPGELEEKGWYVDVFRPAPAGSPVDDPILDCVDRIAWSDRAITIGPTGGTGVGKTTQIGRPQDVLAEKHRIACVAFDYGMFSELSSPPDVTDFLLSLVGGFAREARARDFLPEEWDRARVGRRMLDIFKRLNMPGVEVGVPGVGSITVQDLLSQDESFRAPAFASTCRGV